jgi:metallo-beta-lactamase family protein
MRITCLGASGCVTGSCFLVENGKTKFLVDCGLFQGSKHMETLNRQKWGFHPGSISFLILTHAHIDHSGRIPRLVKDGFRGKIYATPPTAELAKILLLDSAHIQEMEAEWQSRKNRRRGERDVQPLYTVEDAERCLSLFETVSEGETISIDSSFKARFRNAGHILGSSILEIWDGDSPKSHKVVFSGDLGHKNQLIVEDPDPITYADALFIESTYGNRDHKSLEESKKELIEAIHYSFRHGEKVIIPAFAVERTQELLYVLGELFRQKLIPSMPVYLDSPLAIAATEIFRNMKSFYDADTNEIISNGYDPFYFPELTLSRSSRDSMLINETSGPAIVIAGNGMCTAGRIKHHLKHNLWRQGSSLVIVGFQAVGTPGRKIIEGAKTLKIFGESIVVRAKVFTIGGFSAHAGQSDLVEWLSHFENPLMQVYVIHGEKSTSEDFAAVVRERFALQAHVPALGEAIVLGEEQQQVEPREERRWNEHLTNLIQKAEGIRALCERSPGSLPLEVQERLEIELRKAEESLDHILRQAAGARKVVKRS